MLGNGNVVITGMGIISSLGDTPAALHDELAAGTIAIGDTAWPNPPGLVAFYAPIRDFDSESALSAKVAEGTDRFSQFALVAAARAFESAGLSEFEPRRVGVLIGTSMGGLTSLVEGQHALDTKGMDAVDRKLLLRMWPNMAAGQIAMQYGLHGPSLTITTACASSIDAIGTAARLIESGAADVMIAGGTEGWGPLDFPPVHAAAQASLGMLPAIPDPLIASRPFDADRVGIVNGEGAALFILESRAHAEARQAKPIATLLGYASLAEAYHPSSPEPTGKWEALTMREAMAEANVEIDGVYAHGTGTKKGDASEIRAINDVFGERAPEISVMSVKGNIGHCAGAAGSMNVAVALEGMARGEMVPTGGTTTPDPEIRFKLVLEKPDRRELRAVLVNAFGFGGQDAVLVVAGSAH